MKKTERRTCRMNRFGPPRQKRCNLPGPWGVTGGMPRECPLYDFLVKNASRFAFLLACVVAGAGLGDGLPIAEGDVIGRSSPAARTFDLPVVDVKEAPASTVVYLEQVGAYWRLGPAFARVADYMQAHGQTGPAHPMYARFCGHPLKATSAACVTEVGFVANPERKDHPDDAPEAEAPFKTARRRPQLVASIVVEGPVMSTLRYYTPLLAWIDAHGYVPVGPITEVYLSGIGANTRGQRQTEIQVSISPRGGPPQPKSTAGAELNLDHRPPLVPTVPLTPVDPKEAQAPDRMAREVATSTVPAPTVTPTVESEPVQPVQLVQPVHKLVAQGRWDRVAEQLMPDGFVVLTSQQVWFGQVVFRLGALDRGIRYLYPDQEHAVVAFVQAVTERYDTVSKTFTLDPLAQTVVSIDPQGDPTALKQRALLRKLDALLGRVAVKAVGPEDALEAVTDIVQRVQNLVHPDR